jgi:methionine synthase II (cobalamin-independent)
MKRNPDRILVTHAGALPRSEELRDLIFARADGKPYDAAALSAMLRRDVAAVVKKQIACGIDVVNDGELGKTNFTNYVRERVSGFEHRERTHFGARRDGVRGVLQTGRRRLPQSQPALAPGVQSRAALRRPGGAR